MRIKLKESLIVREEREVHLKLKVNGKEVWLSKYSKLDDFGTEADVDFLKGKELLTEEEEDAVMDFINNLE